MEIPTLDKIPKEVLSQIDVQRAFIISRLIVAAERLQVFRLLHSRRRKASSIGRTLKLHISYRDAFLNSLVSLGLLRKSDDTYWNSPFAEKYFVRERSIYWTRQYSKECVQAYDALTVLERVLLTGRTPISIKGLKKPSYIEAMKRNLRQAEDFTQMLFHYHRDRAVALAKYLDLSQHHSLLDVGGGSGVMSIALAKKNPRLRACILDIAPVCKIAARNIRRAGLSERIRTLPRDIRHEFPAGFDVIMFCDIGLVSTQLLINAYDSLPPGGCVVAVDRYLSDDRAKPLDRLVSQFVGSSFPQAKWSEIVAAVRSSGFQSVKAGIIHRDVWCITGTKPGALA